MGKKIVFFDIDGTLLDEKKHLSDSTKQAIKQLQENDIFVALATGRPPFMFKQLRQTLNIDTYISYTGSFVVCRDEVIRRNTMDEEKIIRLHNDAITSEAPIILMGESMMQVTIDKHPHVQKIMDRLQFDYPIVDLAVPSEPVYQVLLFREINQSYIDQFPEFHFLQWADIASDVLPITSSKSAGINTLIDKLGIDIENTYAFGDGLNDLDMIESVGTSVAMANSVPEVLEAADHITTSVNESGVMKGLTELGLI